MTINVQFIDLPNGVSEIVTPNEDGSHTVFLNARHTAEKNREAYKHAVDHIRNNDFQSDMTAQEIESQYK